MKIPLIAALLGVALACAPVYPDPHTAETGAPPTPTPGPTGEPTDSGGASDTADSSPEDTGPIGIVGSWLATGEGVAPLFQADPFHWVEATGTFEADGRYTANALDDAGSSYPVEGIYTVDLSTTPHRITLEQSTAPAAIAEGIYQIEGGQMSWEVVQTFPDYGFTPPTPEAGFGSATGTGLAPGDVVFTYVRQ